MKMYHAGLPQASAAAGWTYLSKSQLGQMRWNEAVGAKSSVRLIASEFCACETDQGPATCQTRSET